MQGLRILDFGFWISDFMVYVVPCVCLEYVWYGLQNIINFFLFFISRNCFQMSLIRVLVDFSRFNSATQFRLHSLDQNKRYPVDRVSPLFPQTRATFPVSDLRITDQTITSEQDRLWTFRPGERTMPSSQNSLVMCQQSILDWFGLDSLDSSTAPRILR